MLYLGFISNVGCKISNFIFKSSAFGPDFTNLSHLRADPISGTVIIAGCVESRLDTFILGTLDFPRVF